jgi:hypothetical protein
MYFYNLVIPIKVDNINMDLRTVWSGLDRSLSG